MLGMNDGEYRPYDDGIFATFAQGYRHLVKQAILQGPKERDQSCTVILAAILFRTLATFMGPEPRSKASRHAYHHAGQTLDQTASSSVSAQPHSWPNRVAIPDAAQEMALCRILLRRVSARESGVRGAYPSIQNVRRLEKLVRDHGKPRGRGELVDLRKAEV